MKKLENLGKALSKVEQKQINGGRPPADGGGCDYYQFRSTEQHCLNMPYSYRPVWIASTKMCSVIGQGPC